MSALIENLETCEMVHARVVQESRNSTNLEEIGGYINRMGKSWEVTRLMENHGEIMGSHLEGSEILGEVLYFVVYSSRCTMTYDWIFA